MIGLLLQNDLITASVRAALDAVASRFLAFQESIAYTLMSFDLYDNVDYFDWTIEAGGLIFHLVLYANLTFW